MAEYAYNSKTQLTKNINVSELKCKGSGHKHNIVVDTKHINNVQYFMNKNGYTKIIISSGYRCKEYCKSRGWSTTSQHTKGKAIDCRFYKGSKSVSAKEVCCKAQDYGFKGIAYIDSYYVHLDNRTIGKYRGDERKGYSNNVGGDFYKYFGIEKGNTYQGKFPVLPKRGYFRKGDRGAEVKNLQRLLNWLNGAKLVVDGDLGDKSLKEVGKYQKKYGLKLDKFFGKDCLAKAKTIKK